MPTHTVPRRNLKDMSEAERRAYDSASRAVRRKRGSTAVEQIQEAVREHTRQRVQESVDDGSILTPLGRRHHAATVDSCVRAAQAKIRLELKQLHQANASVVAASTAEVVGKELVAELTKIDIWRKKEKRTERKIAAVMLTKDGGVLTAYVRDVMLTVAGVRASCEARERLLVSLTESEPELAAALHMLRDGASRESGGSLPDISRDGGEAGDAGQRSGYSSPDDSAEALGGEGGAGREGGEGGAGGEGGEGGEGDGYSSPDDSPEALEGAEDADMEAARLELL
jgi:hypothetical protein